MRILLVVFLLLVGCVASPPFENVMHSRSGGVVHWQPTDFPLEIVVDRRLSPERQYALQEAVTRWNYAIGATVFTISREADWFDNEVFHPEQGNIYILLGDMPDYYEGARTQALTSVQRTGTRFNFAVMGFDLATTEEDARVVFEHELGHTLGLTHDVERSSLMFPFPCSGYGIIMYDDVSFVRWEMNNYGH